jgi:hypothetical protein
MPEICRVGNIQGKLKTAVTNAERMKINKEIKTEVQALDSEGI